MEKARFYLTKSEDLDASILKTKESANLLSMGRLVSFVIAVIGFALGVSDQMVAGYICGVIALVVFAILVVVYNRRNKELSYKNALKEVYDAYVARYSDDWKKFEENGSEYLDGDVNFRKEVAIDLDIFGPGSIFQYINCASSKIGRNKLAKALTLAFSDKVDLDEKGSGANEENAEEEDENSKLSKMLERMASMSKLGIEDRQQAVAELLEKDSFSYRLEAMGRRAKNEAKGKLSEQMVIIVKDSEKEKLFAKVVLVVSLLLVLGGWVTTVLAILGMLPAKIPVIIFIATFLLSQFFDGSFMSKSLEATSCIQLLAAYEGYMEAIAGEEFKSDILKELSDQISKDASQGISQLKTVGSALGFRANPLVYGLLCTFFGFNAFVFVTFTGWKDKYIHRVPVWLSAIGDFEMLMSLAVIGRVKQSSCFPAILEEPKPVARLSEMAHPLIMERNVISNDIELDNDIRLITGSNMSGKTTYLRTLGINAILAYSGGMVMAKSAELSVMEVFTSMRVVDDVNNGISTFYAEVLRIKAMSVYTKKHMPMLVLIDEIFKGTNSADRIVGAKAVIGSLLKPWVTGMVSTHDFELCTLSDKSEMIHNFHFEEHFTDGNIDFDYKIKDGRCTTTNALYILKMAGVNVPAI